MANFKVHTEEGMVVTFTHKGEGMVAYIFAKYFEQLGNIGISKGEMNIPELDNEVVEGKTDEEILDLAVYIFTEDEFGEGIAFGTFEFPFPPNKKVPTWEYIGDENPVEHGGIWIREEEGSNGERFEFIKVQEWFDNHIAVAHGTVDVTDEWIDREAVESYGDVSLEGNTLWYVETVVSYYGIGEFDSSPNYYEVNDQTESAVRAYLNGNGITF